MTRAPVDLCPMCNAEYPCSCVTCPDCDELAPRVGLDFSETLAHVCQSPTCYWREDRCECGAVMTFDPLSRGTTCGGLAIVGARVCVLCGVVEVCKRSCPADAVDWSLAKGGRSLTAGGIKVRAEKTDGNVEALMARIVRVPELELEVERLRGELTKRTRPVVTEGT